MTKHELGKHIENILDKGDKISIFERNILAISTYSATLAKELLEIKENKNFNVYMGADPLALNIINTKNYEYLYKNPLDDVTKQINEFELNYGYEDFTRYTYDNIIRSTSHNTTVSQCSRIFSKF